MVKNEASLPNNRTFILAIFAASVILLFMIFEKNKYVFKWSSTTTIYVVWRISSLMTDITIKFPHVVAR